MVVRSFHRSVLAPFGGGNPLMDEATLPIPILVSVLSQELNLRRQRLDFCKGFKVVSVESVNARDSAKLHRGDNL
jgi:hypothetical protein